MIKRKRSIRILGHKIKVVHTVNSTSAGCYSPAEMKIYINMKENNTQKEYESTLLHEALHALLDLSGFNGMLGDDAEESLVRLMEWNILDLVKEVKC